MYVCVYIYICICLVILIIYLIIHVKDPPTDDDDDAERLKEKLWRRQAATRQLRADYEAFVAFLALLLLSEID